MRTMILIVVAMVGCVPVGERAVAQAVAAPRVSVTVRAAGELAVSWTEDLAAVRYNVRESSALVASVFDSGGGPPATSWIATGLDEREHCYTVESVYADGETSSPGAAACAVASASATRSRRFHPTVIATDGTWSQSDGFGVPCLVSSGVSTTGLYLAIPYEDGDRITGLSLDVKGNGVTDASFAVTTELYNTPLTGASNLALLDDIDRAGGSWSVAVLPNFTPRVLTGDRFLYLTATHNGGGYSIGTVQMFYDRPTAQ